MYAHFTSEAKYVHFTLQIQNTIHFRYKDGALCCQRQNTFTLQIQNALFLMCYFHIWLQSLAVDSCKPLRLQVLIRDSESDGVHCTASLCDE